MLKRLKIIFLSALPFLFGIAGCQSKKGELEGDKPLARVQNKILYLSELDGMFPPEATSGDSTAIIDSYIQRWIRETVLMQEAERNVPSDLNIDKLVRDYRASLIKHNYEKVLVEQRLDSTISQAELTDFYERNKDQYQLETPIIRCYFIKVPLPLPQEEKVRRWWSSSKKEDFGSLVAYCNRYAAAHLLDDSVWYSLEDIEAEMPPGTITADNVSSKREFTQKDSNNQYFFRLFELKNRKEIAPLSYIEGQARKFILHQRMLKLLEEAKEDLFQREQRRNNVEIIFSH
ncbi:MAG TPA: hypothetical protein PKE06_15520 [Flavilitoribacter sp.]|nr:hypothetical protein [Flavilitoribacter sp.]HMQ86098.1 hypothetical protein [Flavilitoribacter sp.]